MEAVQKNEVRQPVVAVDLDGVIVEHTDFAGVRHFGPVREGVRTFLENLVSCGNHVVIHSCRCNPLSVGAESYDPDVAQKLAKVVADFMRENELPFGSIYNGVGKPLADVYIDDRAVSVPSTSVDWGSVYEQMKKIGSLRICAPADEDVDEFVKGMKPKAGKKKNQPKPVFDDEDDEDND